MEPGWKDCPQAIRRRITFIATIMTELFLTSQQRLVSSPRAGDKGCASETMTTTAGKIYMSLTTEKTGCTTTNTVSLLKLARKRESQAREKRGARGARLSTTTAMANLI